MRRRKEEEHALIGVLDLTGVTAFDVDSQVIRRLTLLPPNFPDPTFKAIVAPTDFLFGMMRMFQIGGSETRQQLHVVRTLNEALTLLGAEDAQFNELEAA
jgi:hypothetical protein